MKIKLFIIVTIINTIITIIWFSQTRLFELLATPTTLNILKYNILFVIYTFYYFPAVQISNLMYNLTHSNLFAGIGFFVVALFYMNGWIWYGIYLINKLLIERFMRHKK